MMYILPIIIIFIAFFVIQISDRIWTCRGNIFVLSNSYELKFHLRNYFRQSLKKSKMEIGFSESCNDFLILKRFKMAHPGVFFDVLFSKTIFEIFQKQIESFLEDNCFSLTPISDGTSDFQISFGVKPEKMFDFFEIVFKKSFEEHKKIYLKASGLLFKYDFYGDGIHIYKWGFEKETPQTPPYTWGGYLNRNNLSWSKNFLDFCIFSIKKLFNPSLQPPEIVIDDFDVSQWDQHIDYSRRWDEDENVYISHSLKSISWDKFDERYMRLPPDLKPEDRFESRVTPRKKLPVYNKDGLLVPPSEMTEDDWVAWKKRNRERNSKPAEKRE